jgi:hypothetical protein
MGRHFFEVCNAICRCFRQADIRFVGNSAGCEEQSQIDIEFILVRILVIE